MSAALRSEGYDVRLARAGREATTQALELRPDIALLDLHMPGYSGLRVAQDLQRHYGSHCPMLVAVTASAGRQIAELSGFHHFVAKPYDVRNTFNRRSRARPASQAAPAIPASRGSTSPAG